jgi:hypothetical protein
MVGPMRVKATRATTLALNFMIVECGENWGFLGEKRMTLEMGEVIWRRNMKVSAGRQL